MNERRLPAEFTPKALLTGLIFGVVFGAANAYLGLKVGLTVSTSIPIAVLSVAVFRLLRGGTILEANIAQTVGSASSSLAAGTIFTIPALFMWGYKPSLLQVGILAGLGGLLGILAMIPLRRMLIVKAHGELPYPEGQACAEVLRATEQSSAGSGWIFIGIGLGFAIKLLLGLAHAGPEEVGTAVAGLPNAKLTLAIAPALLAVGYIVGFRASAVMVAGSLLSALVLYPLVTSLHHFGAVEQAANAGGEALAPLSAALVKRRFINFIGAGAVAAAGVVTIIRTSPMMARAFLSVIRGIGGGKDGGAVDRTDRDVPPWVIGAGLAVVFVVLAFVPGVLSGSLSLGERLAATCGVILFGFIFVPVSSRLVGMIGVSSNPTSAMALITLAVTAGVFTAWRLGGPDAKAAVLTVGTVVCVAASKAGDISQDLKTGFLVKGTPALQQVGQIIAATVACWAVAAVVTALGETPGFTGEGAMTAPQANLMRTVVDAVMGAEAPWEFVAVGACLGGVGALAGLPPLPFALGIYLPLATMATIFLGGLLRRFFSAGEEGKGGGGTGVLCASGFVAGEGLAGVLLAGWAYATNATRKELPPATTLQIVTSLALLLIAAVALAKAARAGRKDAAA